MGRDAFAMSLGYYGDADYKGIGTAWDDDQPASIAQRPFAPIGMPGIGSTLATAHKPLYNGNIAHTVNSLQPFGLWGPNGQGQVLAQVYQYDQLNRLLKARGVIGLDEYNTWEGVDDDAATNRYRSEYTYDANGNIVSAERYDADGTGHYDSFEYHYEKNGTRLQRNRLYELFDDAPTTTGDDIVAPPGTFDNSTAGVNANNNYRYDALGNLIRDERAEIHAIDWTVAGKVRSVARTLGSTLKPLLFTYGASGQRVMKQVGVPGTDAGAYREHYIRDAQGNIMATYRYTNPGSISFQLTERPIYGSSRLGSNVKPRQLYNASNLGPVGGAADHIQLPHLRYELTDHLGNVTAVVTGRLLASQSTAPWEPELVSAQGYEPFGSLLPGRNYNIGSYRHLFQGQEHDDEINGGVGTSYAFEYRIHDPRIGRFLSLDPISASYPWNSPYVFAENRVIEGVELEGLEFIRYYDAKIYVWYNGEVHVNLKRCSDAFQDAWKSRDNKLKLSGGNLSLGDKQYLGGYPTRINEITFSLYTPDETNRGAKGLEKLNSLNSAQARNAKAQSRIHRYNNNSTQLDRRFADHKVVAQAMKSAKGSLALEMASVGYEAYSGWKEAFYDGPARSGDLRTISQQQGLVTMAIGAVQDFLNNNSVNPELLVGENGPNLMAYVIMGEMRGNNEGVFRLGDAILDSIGLNKHEKVRTYLPLELGGPTGTQTKTESTSE